MYVCMYVCMYVYMYACMNECLYVYLRIYVCVYACMHIYICMHACMCIDLRGRVYRYPLFVDEVRLLQFCLLHRPRREEGRRAVGRADSEEVAEIRHPQNAIPGRVRSWVYVCIHMDKYQNVLMHKCMYSNQPIHIFIYVCMYIQYAFKLTRMCMYVCAAYHSA